MKKMVLFNKYRVIAFVLFCICGVTRAGFELPRDVYQLSELEEAKTEALKKRKPIAVIFTDINSGCGLCNSASKTMIDELDSRTIIVYLPTSVKPRPDFVNKAFRRGKYIPQVAVFDIELKNILGEVVYEDIEEYGEDAFDDILDRIRAYRKTIK